MTVGFVDEGVLRVRARAGRGERERDSQPNEKMLPSHRVERARGLLCVRRSIHHGLLSLSMALLISDMCYDDVSNQATRDVPSAYPLLAGCRATRPDESGRWGIETQENIYLYIKKESL